MKGVLIVPIIRNKIHGRSKTKEVTSPIVLSLEKYSHFPIAKFRCFSNVKPIG